MDLIIKAGRTLNGNIVMLTSTNMHYYLNSNLEVVASEKAWYSFKSDIVVELITDSFSAKGLRDELLKNVINEALAYINAGNTINDRDIRHGDIDMIFDSLIADKGIKSISKYIHYISSGKYRL